MTGRDLKRVPQVRDGSMTVSRGYAGNAGSNSIREGVHAVDNAMNRAKRRR